MSNWNRIPFAAALGLGTMALAAVLQAEVPNQSPEALKKNATHIVTGNVEKVTEISTKSENTDDIKGVCEITVTTCEKGEGIASARLSRPVTSEARGWSIRRGVPEWI